MTAAGACLSGGRLDLGLLILFEVVILVADDQSLGVEDLLAISIAQDEYVGAGKKEGSCPAETVGPAEVPVLVGLLQLWDHHGRVEK